MPQSCGEIFLSQTIKAQTCFYFKDSSCKNCPKRRVEIARALATEPKLLLPDEPSLGLAPLVVRKIFDIIRTVNQQGITVLLNEQNANMALKVADYAYVLETGNLTMSGTGAQRLSDPQVKAAYLGKKR